MGSARGGVAVSAVRLEAAGGSHVGCVRRRNEDCFAAVPELGLFVVADGIGGKPGGEIASGMAVEVVRACIEEDDPEETRPCGHGRVGDRDEQRFIFGLRKANRAIFTAGRVVERRGMGTTFAGVLVSGGGAYIAHVGDSRVYRYRCGRLERLTRDHTVLEDLLRDGGARIESLDPLDEEIACRITRALGTDPTVDVEMRVEAVELGDTFLLCTDGLWAPVPDGEIADILGWSCSLAGKIAGLIARALEQGGPDNVTCVVAQVEGA
jgi:serine/threonine protein phosphatase PrpC